MRSLICLVLVLSGFQLTAQDPSTLKTQTIRGSVLDADSKMPLIGASVILLDSDPIVGGITDFAGDFMLENVPIGRQSLQVTAMGYEPRYLNNLLLTAGKQLVLTVELIESVEEVGEAVIEAGKSDGEPLNEMATVSARSFSVEQTQRYAASAFDPARMALSFAGANSSGDDVFNEISVRGNSPKGILWRLEGIEIPNPNHFSGLGSGGGAISMLSSSTMGGSDFYTGAFPAEFGNATSGVFDMRLRNGNNQQREFSLMAGLWGLEASTEGYFTEDSKASYLVNYRYSTLALIGNFVPAIGDVVPKYQDISFKVDLPTEKFGRFGIFGLGGINSSEDIASQDPGDWEDIYANDSYTEQQSMGVIGLSHFLIVGENTYLKTVALVSGDTYEDESWEWDAQDTNEKFVYDVTTFKNSALRISTMLNSKLNSRHTIRTGVIASRLGFNLKYDSWDWDTSQWEAFMDTEGSAGQIQAYAQWKYRLSPTWTLNTGLHSMTYLLNDTYTVEPRAALTWAVSEKQSISLAAGVHSKPEHVTTYLVDKDPTPGIVSQPNRELEIPKAFHLVLGTRAQLSRTWSITAETYYQELWDVPVESDPLSTYSIVNAADVWGVVYADSLVSEGGGQNLGVELTLERAFVDNQYVLFTASIYDSKYTTKDGREFNTRFNGNYAFNLLGGKEWEVGNNENLLGVNAKLVYTGGIRQTPVDLEASMIAGETVRDNENIFGARYPDYYRLDLGFSYKINRERLTHSILIDIQNVTNRQNVFSQFYDAELGEMVSSYQAGLLPFLNYRIEFQGKAR